MICGQTDNDARTDGLDAQVLLSHLTLYKSVCPATQLTAARKETMSIYSDPQVHAQLMTLQQLRRAEADQWTY